MTHHKFSVGEIVRYTPDASQDKSSANGLYEIVGQLPHELAGFSYRLRHTADGHQRIAREQQLTKAN